MEINRCEGCGVIVDGELRPTRTNYFRDDEIAFLCEPCATKAELKKGAVELELWEDFARAMKPAARTIAEQDLEEIADVSDCPGVEIEDFFGEGGKPLTKVQKELLKISIVLDNQCLSESKKHQLLLRGFLKFKNGIRGVYKGE